MEEIEQPILRHLLTTCKWFQSVVTFYCHGGQMLCGFTLLSHFLFNFSLCLAKKSSVHIYSSLTVIVVFYR